MDRGYFESLFGWIGVFTGLSMYTAFRSPLKKWSRKWDPSRKEIEAERNRRRKIMLQERQQRLKEKMEDAKKNVSDTTRSVSRKFSKPEDSLTSQHSSKV
mmetsp:Transcript_10927/g.19755  ORF Transcript_10927/g.19755 Transcript_10927/m.19755 type:complete len:100 (-) Transcript_10927:251-550(-)